MLVLAVDRRQGDCASADVFSHSVTVHSQRGSLG